MSVNSPPAGSHLAQQRFINSQLSQLSTMSSSTSVASGDDMVVIPNPLVSITFTIHAVRNFKRNNKKVNSAYICFELPCNGTMIRTDAKIMDDGETEWLEEKTLMIKDLRITRDTTVYVGVIKQKEKGKAEIVGVLNFFVGDMIITEFSQPKWYQLLKAKGTGSSTGTRSLGDIKLSYVANFLTDENRSGSDNELHVQDSNSKGRIYRSVKKTSSSIIEEFPKIGDRSTLNAPPFFVSKAPIEGSLCNADGNEPTTDQEDDDSGRGHGQSGSSMNMAMSARDFEYLDQEYTLVFQFGSYKGGPTFIGSKCTIRGEVSITSLARKVKTPKFNYIQNTVGSAEMNGCKVNVALTKDMKRNETLKIKFLFDNPMIFGLRMEAGRINLRVVDFIDCDLNGEECIEVFNTAVPLERVNQRTYQYPGTHWVDSPQGRNGAIDLIGYLYKGKIDGDHASDDEDQEDLEDGPDAEDLNNQVMDMLLSTKMGSVTDLLFGDSLEMLKALKEKGNQYNLEAKPWVDNKRELTFQYKSKLASSNGISEVTLERDEPSIKVYTTKTKMPQVPSGTSFYVLERTILRRRAESVTQIRLSNDVVFTSSPLLKKAIMSNTVSSLQIAATLLADALEQKFGREQKNKKKDEKAGRLGDGGDVMVENKSERGVLGALGGVVLKGIDVIAEYFDVDHVVSILLVVMFIILIHLEMKVNDINDRLDVIADDLLAQRASVGTCPSQ